MQPETLADLQTAERLATTKLRPKKLLLHGTCQFDMAYWQLYDLLASGKLAAGLQHVEWIILHGSHDSCIPLVRLHKRMRVVVVLSCCLLSVLRQGHEGRALQSYLLKLHPSAQAAHQAVYTYI
jgi:hypothetical protein